MQQANTVNTDLCFPEIVPVPPLTVSGETLRLSLFIVSPISFATGSPGLWYSQPITQATVPLAAFWVLIINIIIEIVSLVCKRNPCVSPINSLYEGPPGSVTTTLPDLLILLKQLQKGQIPDTVKRYTPKQPVSPGVEIGAPSFFTVFLLLSGFFEPGEATSRVSLFVPIFSITGMTGGLPILILGLIATILIRHVVPPTSSGVRPLPEPEGDPKFEFSLKEIINLLRGFGPNFK